MRKPIAPSIITLAFVLSFIGGCTSDPSSSSSTSTSAGGSSGTTGAPAPPAAKNFTLKGRSK